MSKIKDDIAYLKKRIAELQARLADDSFYHRCEFGEHGKSKTALIKQYQELDRELIREAEQKLDKLLKLNLK